MIENNNKLIYHDQTIINSVFLEKLHCYLQNMEFLIIVIYKLYMNKQKNIDIKYKYSKKELKIVYYHPKILHYNKLKHWRIRKGHGIYLWWNYAKKTGYYKEMINTFFKKTKKKRKKQKNKKIKNKKNKKNKKKELKVKYRAFF